MIGFLHIKVPVIAIWICLISIAPAKSANASPALQPFTAQYQLNRGKMIIGKVTTTLQLDADSNYIYRSVTVPVGIVAAFSSDEITEESRGAIQGKRVIPSSYYYHHKRKKRPKLRQIEFDWSKGKATGTAAKPPWSMRITKGAQDSSSKMLTMMLRLNSRSKSLDLNVIDRSKLKRYRVEQVSNEQIVSGNNKYDTVQLQVIKAGEPTGTKFWLAPKLNYLPIKVERLEKKQIFTMILTKFTQVQPEPPPARDKASVN